MLGKRGACLILFTSWFLISLGSWLVLDDSSSSAVFTLKWSHVMDDEFRLIFFRLKMRTFLRCVHQSDGRQTSGMLLRQLRPSQQIYAYEHIAILHEVYCIIHV